MEEKNTLELRMYGLCNYQLTGIQKGIQFLHGVVEYSLLHGISEQYMDWAKNWKTVILLNGGTTNDNPKWFGTLNQHAQTLSEMNVPIARFYEPDLGDQLTSVVFIVDERVFNKEKYPDPVYQFTELTSQLVTEINEKIQEEFINSIGGYTNFKLREFLKQFRLA